jgi:DNA-binding NarL/FixJ family response regulator
VRVIICEDHALVRDGLERLLGTHGFEVVASVDNPPAFLSAVRHESPDVCVVDVRLPPSFTDEGVRAAIEARQLVPGLPILILSQYVEHTFARELFTSGEGGVGYLLKDRVAAPGQFVEAVRRVAEGGTALDPEAVAALLGRNDRQGRLDLLTPREHEVLTLMAEGRSNGGIAEALVVSERAVEKHVSNIFWKLDLPASGKEHRRVLAVLAWLQAQG